MYSIQITFDPKTCMVPVTYCFLSSYPQLQLFKKNMYFSNVYIFVMHVYLVIKLHNQIFQFGYLRKMDIFCQGGTTPERAPYGTNVSVNIF